MANNVFANGREINCKKGSGKSICAFPDVAWTPPDKVPPTPTGVPVPYPNTGMAKDCSKGSKKVKISGKEVILKNKSHFKKSMGDEAGVAQLKGFMTMKNRGKIYFQMWSMNVKVEGMNAVRHFDIGTHNHGSQVGNSPPWPYVDTSATPTSENCKGDRDAKESACEGKEDPHCPGVLSRSKSNLKEQVAKSPSKRGGDVRALDSKPRGAESRTSKAGRVAATEANMDECVKKSRCQLKPYRPTKSQPKCCPGQTAHHVPPKACCAKLSNYKSDKALCICLEGTNQHSGSHGRNHRAIDYVAEKKGIDPNSNVKIKDYNAICAQTIETQFGCKKECIEEQLNHSLKPTNRNIVHKPSNSNVELSADDESALDKLYGAPVVGGFSG